MAEIGKYGKDNPERFIDSALKGGSGPSNEIVDSKLDRPGQTIKTALGMDNVTLAMDIPSSIKEEGGFRGGVDNLDHSLRGASAENTDVGAAGPVKKTLIKDH